MKLKYSLKLLTILTILTLPCLTSNGQTINDAFALVADTTGQNNYFTIVLSDTTNISEIEVKLGSEPASSDLLLHSFVFDSQPSSPYSYSRSANIVKIGIGTITLNDIYYGEARLKYSNGSWSSPFQFISN